jgi:hypothetical protein
VADSVVPFDDPLDAQCACLDNARHWLEFAYNSFGPQEASILFAHAVRELGKALTIFRNARMGRAIDAAFTTASTYELLSVTLSVLDEDDLDVAAQPRTKEPIVDLMLRFDAFAVRPRGAPAQWASAPLADEERLRERLKRVLDKISLVWDLESVLKTPVQEFAPLATDPGARWDDTVRAALRRQQERPGNKRGPTPDLYTPEFLSWLNRNEPSLRRVAADFCRKVLRNPELTRGQRRSAAEALVATTGQGAGEIQSELVRRLIRRENRPTDVLNILVRAYWPSASESAARRARHLLAQARVEPNTTQ